MTGQMCISFLYKSDTLLCFFKKLKNNYWQFFSVVDHIFFFFCNLAAFTLFKIAITLLLQINF